MSKLREFLLGTIDPHSPVRILRGKGDVLRIIWCYACSEWWYLHIQPYLSPLLDGAIIPDLRNNSLYDRKELFDCPVAIIDTHLTFPSPSPVNEPIYLNMMPFDLLDLEATLPAFVHAYLPMIIKCRSYVKSYADMMNASGKGTRSPEDDDINAVDYTDMKNRIAYLTIDERPLEGANKSHRRSGVHVECPGAMRRKEVADKSQYTPDLSYYHHWGIGQAAGEYLIGGIFLASNVSNSTAVWNSRVHDTFGDIIGPHGSLERMRDLLGPPTKCLDAGELIWLSDRTPHESLPIEDATTRRQFFRLVVGEIAFWFADHNTPNPTGFQVPSFVPIIHGNKFDLGKRLVPVVWECGNEKELKVAWEEISFRENLYNHSIGFIADELLKIGIYNQGTLREKFTEATNYLNSLDAQYFSRYSISYIRNALLQVRYGR